MEFESTSDLLLRAQRGDSSATDELLRRCQPRLRHIVALRVGYRLAEIGAEIDDIVQEALLDAFRGLNEFAPRSEGALLHWLSELAANRFRDYWRREHAVKRGGGAAKEFDVYGSNVLCSSILDGNATTPSERAMGTELERRVESCLLELPETDRQVIVMARLCGLNHAEICDALKLGAESSSRALLARALVKLSQCLNLEDGLGRALTS